jgi:N-acetylmuramoyl-L-alanine amidase
MIDPDERARFANESNADLFISIHAAAADHLATRGCQTFFWGVSAGGGASEFMTFEDVTEDQAVVLAARDDDIAATSGWMMPVRQFASSRLAELIQSRLEDNVNLPSRGVDQVNLTVMGMVGMPCVAVNAGFISHPEDEELLRKKSYQKKVARAIYDAVGALRRELETRP